MSSETRVCNRCQIDKPLDAGHYKQVASRRGSLYFLRTCIECRKPPPRGTRNRYATEAEAKLAKKIRARGSYGRKSPESKRRYLDRLKIKYAEHVAKHGRDELNKKQRDRYARRSDEQRIKDKLVAASYAGAKRRAKRAGVSEHVLPSELLKLYNDAFGLCTYCALPHGDTAAIDHIIPLDQGGSNTIDNLAVTCALCNAMKSRRTPEQWLGPDWEIRRAAMLCNIQPYNYTLEVPQ